MAATPPQGPPTQAAVMMPVLPPAPAYALYPPNAVALATFLGAPIGGAMILAKNYRRLGRPEAGRQALLWGCSRRWR